MHEMVYIYYLYYKSLNNNVSSIELVISATLNFCLISHRLAYDNQSWHVRHRQGWFREQIWDLLRAGLISRNVGMVFRNAKHNNFEFPVEDQSIRHGTAISLCSRLEKFLPNRFWFMLCCCGNLQKSFLVHTFYRLSPQWAFHRKKISFMSDKWLNQVLIKKSELDGQWIMVTG